jgi:ATP-dependent helicase/nuclease subunit B
MLRIVTGSFHPHLETALVKEVRQLKADDVLGPLAIIVPSDAIRQRLKWLLGIEHRLSLLDVHIWTFHQMAVRLVEETDPAALPTIQSPFFFKELLHQLLRQQTAGVSATRTRKGETGARWQGLAEMPGAWAALWATLKDLKDAAVPADKEIERAVNAASSDQATLSALFELYGRFLGVREHLALWDRDDLAVLAAERVAGSSVLRRQRRILYYGFYDLTQVQLDVFHAVARAYPTSLFFPLVKADPAYGFATRFFERYIHGQAAGDGGIRLEADAIEPPAVIRSTSATTRIMQVSGLEDEVTVAAKEIIGLVEERGYAFHEIGVVARSLSGYTDTLPRVFAQQGIPFTSSIGRPLTAFPLIKTAIQLAHLRLSGLYRQEVVDVLASPFLRLSALCANCEDPRADLWDLASRRLGIVKGMDEWARLEAYVATGVSLREQEDASEEGAGIPGAQVDALWKAVRRLDDALGALPEQASWERHVEQVWTLFQDHLDMTLDPAAGEGLHAVLEDLRTLDRIGCDTSLTDFLAALSRLADETMVPLDQAVDHAGVRVLDAMAARGVPFKVLFILGLNEKVFPRHIQEDAFLRDQARRVLDADLGFKISEKLAAYDEEQLLFRLLVQSAGDELRLLYQRTDRDGRPLVPSNYLAAVRQSGAETPEIVVPRRLTDKLEHAALPQYGTERLTPSEQGRRLLLERRVPGHLTGEATPFASLLASGLPALQAQELGRPSLGPYDGITGHLPEYWARLKEAGVAPTSLQRYATCPFQYFARHILHLELLSAPEAVYEITPSDRGSLVHAILAACLKSLHDRGLFADPPALRIDPLVELDRAAQPIFAEFARTHPVGYPLLWELEQEALSAFLKDVLMEDLEDMRRHEGEEWQPILFEAPLGGMLAARTAGQVESIRLRGRVDRVDWNPKRNAYRVIDYKYTGKSQLGTMDKNLTRAAIRAMRLQPPLYLTMAQASMPALLRGIADVSASPSDRLICEGVSFHYLAPNATRKGGEAVTVASFPGDAWESELRGPLHNAMSHVLDGIREGRFFIYPGGYCDYCDYRPLCRRTHQTGGWRARADHRLVQPHRLLRKAVEPGKAKSDTSGKKGSAGEEP